MQQLIDVLHRERQAAEATLGRPLINPYAFAADCLTHGLGQALNAEQGRIDDWISTMCCTSETAYHHQRKELLFMSPPIRGQTPALIPAIPDGLSRSERKQLRRVQTAELARGMAAAIRVQAAAMVAASGIQASGLLGREAAFHRSAPISPRQVD